MSTLPPKDVALANLDKVVQDTLAYFAGPGWRRTPGSISGRPGTS